MTSESRKLSVPALALAGAFTWRFGMLLLGAN